MQIIYITRGQQSREREKTEIVQNKFFPLFFSKIVGYFYEIILFIEYKNENLWLINPNPQMFWHGIKSKPNKKRLLYNKHIMHVCITKRVTLKSSLYVKCKFSSVQVQNVENVEGEFRGLVYMALIMYLFPFCFCAFGYNRIFRKTVLIFLGYFSASSADPINSKNIFTIPCWFI